MTRHGSNRPLPSFFQTDRGRLLLWILGVGLGAFLLGYAATAVLFFPGSRRDVITVPEVRGRTEAEARRALEEVDLVLERGSSLVHPQAPAGTVLAQSPLPGREVARGAAVQVTLSSGRERRAVPEIGSMNSEQARQFLARAGFEVEVEEVHNSRRAGTVLELRPAAGTQVEMPGRVLMVVSAGPPPVPVLEVLGLSLDAARDALAGAGLRLGDVDYDWLSERPEGEVIAQRPLAGDTVPAGSRVRVTLAGPPPLVFPRDTL